jgi:hypothetical protein
MNPIKGATPLWMLISVVLDVLKLLMIPQCPSLRKIPRKV